VLRYFCLPELIFLQPGLVALLVVRYFAGVNRGYWFDRIFFGLVAQLVEQLTLNQRVQGPSPCGTTSHFMKPTTVVGFTFSDPLGSKMRLCIVAG
jgi:hypothetical protein